MRIAAYQFHVTGDINHNFKETCHAIELAANNNVELLIFPECALTGYPPRDIPKASKIDFELVREFQAKLKELSDEKNISFVVGAVTKDGEKIHNSAIFFQPKKECGIYHKRALWGWDRENFDPGCECGIFKIKDFTIGIRICFEVRFPEYFRELFQKQTDLNIVLFYDVSDHDDVERYSLIKSHLQTRAVENVTTTISVNTIKPFQTAPTAVIGKSGEILKECVRNEKELLIFDVEKSMDSFGEEGRREISNSWGRKT